MLTYTQYSVGRRISYTVGNSEANPDMCNMWSCAIPRNKIRKQGLELHKIRDILLSPNFVLQLPTLLAPADLCWEGLASNSLCSSSPLRHHHWALAQMRTAGSELQQQERENTCGHCFSRKMLSCSQKSNSSWRQLLSCGSKVLSVYRWTVPLLAEQHWMKHPISCTFHDFQLQMSLSLLSSSVILSARLEKMHSSCSKTAQSC